MQNEIDQASVVASDIMGITVPSPSAATFWSDQYDAKIQIVGLPTDHDRVIERNDYGQSFWAFAGSRLVNVYAINEPSAVMLGKMGLSGRMNIESDLIENQSQSLKDIHRHALASSH